MKNATQTLFSGLLIWLLPLLCSPLSAQQGVAGNHSGGFRNTSLPLEERVNNLVLQMTLQEKISQMQHAAPAIERLGVPAYNWWNECLHGVGRNGYATVFPQAVAMAATWNDGLIFREADIISTEARAKYAEAIAKNERGIYQGLTFWSPNINIFRDPRWGRGQETYGEDPLLTAAIGSAFVKGLQGNDPKYYKIIATAKHFAVHSGPEPDRHRFDAWSSMTDLYETYLPAFETLITEAKAYSVMGAYNRLFGTPACASDLLMKELLRGKWNFDGYVVSDCWAISDFYKFHKFVGDAAQASALAVKAGTDLACGEEYQFLNQAIEKGYLTEADIDLSVKRLFTARFKLGMFDPDSMVPWASITPAMNDTPEHSEFAREVARQSLVLLKNSQNVLPIQRNVKSIAVIGPYANDISVLLGNYNGTPSAPVTLLKGIEERAGKRIKISNALGTLAPEKLSRDSSLRANEPALEAEALKIATNADLVIFVGGISPNLEGEEMRVQVPGFQGGDRTSLDMPQAQTDLLKKLHALGKPVVLLLTNGSALSIPWAQENIPAIVECWYPGQQGGRAVADILFGDFSPAGRLPVTFYNSVDDLPPFEDYSMEGRTYKYFRGKPLYAFGHGLSYTRFDYSVPTLKKQQVAAGDTVFITVPVKNAGNYASDEVVQIYMKQPATLGHKATQSLVAFRREPFTKGESRNLTFAIPTRLFRHFDAKTGLYETAPGTYTLRIGAASDDIRQEIEVSVTSAR